MMQNDNIQLSPRQITTVAPQDTTEIQLRLIDWRRIYRKVKSISPGVSGRELFAGVLWGITGSALLSLLPLYQATQSTEPWVKPTFWLVSAASLIVGIVVWIGSKDYTKDVKVVRDEIVVDMKEIHSLYFPGEDLN
ncbi:MAG: hypothetical protein EBR40_06470 [Proteobacteria bacterium]|nr:hypothetical protein [Pseudomonadota bacterium]